MPAKQLDELREMKAKRPFIPFRILTAGGEKYVVQDRLQFSVTDTLVVYVYRGTDRFVHLNPDQIVAVEAVEQKPAA